MSSRPRLSGWPGCLLLVALSSVGHTIASWGVDAPWIAPDEIIYGWLGRSLWSTGRLTLLGVEGPFYGIVYPALAGLPLSLFGLVDGIHALQVVQPLVMSVTGLVVFAWARRLVSNRLALVATALALAVPAFAYAGLLMTEVAFYPLATLALLLLARAVEKPSLERQAFVVTAILVACLTRLQGLVLLPALVTAVVLAALFDRSAVLLRRFMPTLVLLAVGGALLVAFHETGASRDLLGAYGTTAGASYQIGPALRWIVWHGGVVFLLVAGAPLLGTIILALEAVRGRERSPAARALLAVAVSFTTWSVLQVGLFASRFSTVLLERNLVSVAPPLFVAFVLWLERGLPRPQPQTAIACALVAVPAVVVPAGRLTDPAAAPSALTTLPFAHLLGWTSLGWTRAVWIAGVVVVLLLVVALPRRVQWALPALTLALLAGASAVASHDVRALAATLRGNLFDSAQRAWIDRATAAHVTYVYDGSVYWNGVWIRAFWNPRIDQVVALAGPLPGALPPHDTISPRFDGRLFAADGSGIRNDYVLASERLTFVGTPIRSVTAPIDGSTLTLWKLDPPARLRLLRTGFQSNGDFSGRAQVDVFGCSRGALEVTLLGKDGSPVTLSAVDGVSRTVAPRPRVGVHLALPTPTGATGSERCTFLLDTPGLVGTTVITFTPAG